MKPEHQQAVQQMIEAGTPRDQVVDYVKTHSEAAVDLDNLPRQTHNWVRRGLKMSCEGAGHPHHSHFLFTPKH